MANLQVQLYRSTALRTSIGSAEPLRSTNQSMLRASPDHQNLTVRRNRQRRVTLDNLKVKSSLDATAAAESASAPAVTPVVGTVTEVDKDTFWPIVNAAGEKTVVLDMYTQWCGPCKVIAPKYKQLSEKYDDVIFLKMDCNQENKPLAKELGIKVVPTFKILKDNKIVKEVTGAKIDDLVAAIEKARST